MRNMITKFTFAKTLVVLCLCPPQIYGALPRDAGDGGGAGGGNHRRLIAYVSIVHKFRFEYDPELQLDELTDGGVVVCNASRVLGHPAKNCDPAQDPNRKISRLTVHPIAATAEEKADLIKFAKERFDAKKPRLFDPAIRPTGVTWMIEEESASVGLHQMYVFVSPTGELIAVEIQAGDVAEGLTMLEPVLASFHFDVEGPEILDIELPHEIDVSDSQAMMFRFRARDDLSGVATQWPTARVAIHLVHVEDAIAWEKSSKGMGQVLTRSPEAFGKVMGTDNATYVSVRALADDWYEVSVPSSAKKSIRYMKAGTYAMYGFCIFDNAGNPSSLTVDGPASSYPTAQYRKNVGETTRTIPTNMKMRFTRYRDLDFEDLEAPAIEAFSILPEGLKFKSGLLINPEAIKLEIKDDSLKLPTATFRFSISFTPLVPNVPYTYNVMQLSVEVAKDASTGALKLTMTDPSIDPRASRGVAFFSGEALITDLEVFDGSGKMTRYSNPPPGKGTLPKEGLQKFKAIGRLGEELVLPRLELSPTVRFTSDSPLQDFEEPWIAKVALPKVIERSASEPTRFRFQIEDPGGSGVDGVPISLGLMHPRQPTDTKSSPVEYFWDLKLLQESAPANAEGQRWYYVELPKERMEWSAPGTVLLFHVSFPDRAGNWHYYALTFEESSQKIRPANILKDDLTMEIR